MSKQLVTTALLFFFSSVYFTAVGQGKNYGILRLNKESIQSFYKNNVSYLVFSYKNPFLASRKLECTPFDANGVAMKSFKPKKILRHDKQELVNSYFDGILVLPIQQMKDSGADGTFDLDFVPIKCDQCKNGEFVSYMIVRSASDFLSTNTANVIGSIITKPVQYSGPGNSVGLKTKFRPLAFKNIQMNPSPPYVGGL